MTDWNPELYLQFESERTQPSIDLVAKIPHPAPTSILDVGCGPGNSTQVLVNRWPAAHVIGLDSSTSMIATARDSYPQQEWIHGDITTFVPGRKFDIIFSNAVFQWIPDHNMLFEQLQSILQENGVLAIQLPLFLDMPLRHVIKEVAKDERWKSRTKMVGSLFTIHPYTFYYDLLSSLFDSVTLWKTDYMHILENHEAMITMMRSTGLKPYCEQLNSTEIADFEAMVIKGIKNVYPLQKDTKVILPFKRLFCIGVK